MIDLSKTIQLFIVTMPDSVEVTTTYSEAAAAMQGVEVDPGDTELYGIADHVVDIADIFTAGEDDALRLIDNVSIDPITDYINAIGRKAAIKRLLSLPSDATVCVDELFDHCGGAIQEAYNAGFAIGLG